MRELDNRRTLDVDDGEKTGACGQDGDDRILRAPIRKIRRGMPFVEFECEKLCKLLDAKRTSSCCDAMEQTPRKFPVLLVDLLQRALICRVECQRQVIESTPDPLWEAVAEMDELTVHPSEPT